MTGVKLIPFSVAASLLGCLGADEANFGELRVEFVRVKPARSVDFASSCDACWIPKTCQLS